MSLPVVLAALAGRPTDSSRGLPGGPGVRARRALAETERVSCPVRIGGCGSSKLLRQKIALGPHAEGGHRPQNGWFVGATAPVRTAADHQWARARCAAGIGGHGPSEWMRQDIALCSPTGKEGRRGGDEFTGSVKTAQTSTDDQWARDLPGPAAVRRPTIHPHGAPRLHTAYLTGCPGSICVLQILANGACKLQINR